MNLGRFAVVSGCLMLGLVTAGCSKKTVNDQALVTDIQSKLYADPSARSANVKVSVANGVATLTGEAPSSDVALTVVNIANGTSGVARVDNQLTVAGAPAVQAMAASPNPPPVTAPAPVSKPASVAAPPAQYPAPVPAPSDVQVPPANRQPLPPPPPPTPVTETIPAGVDVAVQMIDGISSKTNTSGQTFRASLATALVVDGKTLFPAGSNATVLLADAKGAGRIKGNSELEVRLVGLERGGKTYKVDSNVHEVLGKGRGKQSAVRTGVGAAAGAIIGAIAGGGKGAAIGSLAGGGAGAGFQLATHGQQVNIPSETELTFTLQSPIEVTLHREK